MTRKRWGDDEIAVLRAHYTTTRARDLMALLPCRNERQIFYKAKRLGIRKPIEVIAAMARESMQNPNHGGRAHQFKKDAAPWNAGKKGWQAGGRAPATQFKTGHKPHTWHPIGHERITHDGYRQRKLTDTGVTRRDYVNVHHLVWIELRGQIPPGHILIFRDGNPANITIDNLECISRAENMRRNTYHNYPKEIAQLIQLRGALNRKINHAAKKEASACPATPSPTRDPRCSTPCAP